MIIALISLILLSLISIFLSWEIHANDKQITLKDNSLKITSLVDELDIPSGIEFIGDDILVLEKNSGQIKVIRNDSLKKYPAIHLNTTSANSGSGLMGIAVLEKNRIWYVYLFNSERMDNSDEISTNIIRNKVYRFTWNSSGLELTDRITLLDAVSGYNSSNNGGKIVVGPDGFLYVTLGDLNKLGKEQNIPVSISPFSAFLGTNPQSGAILRLTLDGNPVDDNPFSEVGFENYYAFGIRNSFGIAFDPETNYLWDTEQGPMVFDEVNLVKPGFNSGWKSVQGNSSDDCCKNSSLNLSQNINKLFNIRGSYYDEPKFVFRNAAGVSDLIFMNSSSLGEVYDNTLFVADLQGNIFNFELTSDREDLLFNRNITENLFLSGLGPISDLNVDSRGLLYVVTYYNSNDLHYINYYCTLYVI
jgi:glucose/arabinose dehydrogenase